MASTYLDTTNFGLSFAQQNSHRSNFTNNQATVRRAYYGCISYVDGLIGELLQALKDGGAEQETAVVFTGESGSTCHLQLHFLIKGYRLCSPFLKWARLIRNSFR